MAYINLQVMTICAVVKWWAEKHKKRRK